MFIGIRAPHSGSIFNFRPDKGFYRLILLQTDWGRGAKPLISIFFGLILGKNDYFWGLEIFMDFFFGGGGVTSNFDNFNGLILNKLQ